MSVRLPDGGEGIDPDSRSGRAREERMLVKPEMDTDGKATGIYLVVSGNSGSTYRVDIGGSENRCTCPDHEHRRVRCKHMRRVALQIQEQDMPQPGEEMGEYAEVLDEAREEIKAEIEEVENQIDALREERDVLRSMMEPL